MGKPVRGHLFGHRFFDDSMDHGFLLFDEDRDLYATRATWSALCHSSTAAEVSALCRSEWGQGLHQIPQRFFTPFEILPAVEQIAEAKPTVGRLPGFNTVTCPECGSNEHTRLYRWFMGHKTVWWCDFCVHTVPTLRAVRS